jgi:hypothetical protein
MICKIEKTDKILIQQWYDTPSPGDFEKAQKEIVKLFPGCDTLEIKNYGDPMPSNYVKEGVKLIHELLEAGLKKVILTPGNSAISICTAIGAAKKLKGIVDVEIREMENTY